MSKSFIDEIVAQKERAQKREEAKPHEDMSIGSHEKKVNFPVTMTEYERNWWLIRSQKSRKNGKKRSMAAICKEALERELGKPEGDP